MTRLLQAWRELARENADVHHGGDMRAMLRASLAYLAVLAGLVLEAALLAAAWPS